MDTTIQEFLDKINSSHDKPIYDLTPGEARKVLDNIQSELIDETQLFVERVSIRNGDASIKIIRPKSVSNIILPCVLFFHGGGWILGNEQSHARLVTEICLRSNIAVAYLLFQNAPEANYKKILVQAHDFVDYIINNSAKHHIDKDSLILAGDSVGGNMSIAMTLTNNYLNRVWPRFLHQILLYPVTDSSMSTASYQKYSDGLWLTQKSMEWFWNAYVPNGEIRSEYFISPILTPKDLLANTPPPPTLIITNENDVLRDEGEAYAHKLMTDGVSVFAVRIIGDIHDFLMLDPLKDSVIVKNAMNLIIDTINQATK
jgi:acetyl esterase